MALRIFVLGGTIGCGDSGDPIAATEATEAGPVGSSSSDAAGSTDTAPEGPCSPNQICASLAPEGWQGPVVRYLSGAGEDAPACADPWPDSDLAFFDAYIEPGPVECACECIVDVTGVCYTGVWRHEASATCDTYSEFVVLSAGECVPIEVTSGGMTANIFGSGVPGCEAVVEAEIPPPQWGQLVSACTGALEGDACGDSDGRCLPAPPDGFAEELCVYRSGDEPCPSDSVYAEKALVYNGVAEDTRACTGCVCGEVGAVTCEGTVDAYRSDDCSGAVETSVDPASCSSGIEDVASVLVALSDPPTCDKISDVEPVGSIAPGGIFTYCCEGSQK